MADGTLWLKALAAGPASSPHVSCTHSPQWQPGIDAVTLLAAGAVLTCACCSPVSQVRYVLKNLVRDWAAEGQAERQQSYGRIVQELKARFAGW